MSYDFYQANEAIKEILIKGDPASVLRIDNTAGYVIDCHQKNIPVNPQWYNVNTMFEGGIYPTDLRYTFEVIYPETVKCMARADLLGFVDISGEIKKAEWIVQCFGDKPMFFLDGFLVMDPAPLLGYTGKENIYIGHLPPPDNFVPWTKYLAGKKVLCVSTHRESMLKQWNNMNNIWGDKRDLIAPFELVDVIRAPYHPAIDDRQYPDCPNWGEMVTRIMQDMDRLEYDVLLAGATTSSPFLVNHAKNRGKIGIQTGGTLQLFFGIKGGRWMKEPHYSKWNDMINEHWIYPLTIDEPQKRKELTSLESFRAYWN